MVSCDGLFVPLFALADEYSHISYGSIPRHCMHASVAISAGGRHLHMQKHSRHARGVNALLPFPSIRLAFLWPTVRCNVRA
jgi:hypothetical protein